MYFMLAYIFVTESFTDILEFITYKTLIFLKRNHKYLRNNNNNNKNLGKEYIQ